MSDVLEIARGYLAAGLGVIPIRQGGSKAPALPRGHPYLYQLPSDADLVRWFESDQHGIGIPGGKVSGGLECLDFETESSWADWLTILAQLAPGLVDRLSWAKTPGHLDGPGVHGRYRCHASIPASTVLAWRPALDGHGRQLKNDRGRLVWEGLIETRGEGGYALAPGSPAGCHKSGRAYQHLRGPALTDLPVLTGAERDLLVAAARRLDQRIEPAPSPGFRPGDDYNARATWQEVLGPSWSVDHQSGELTCWTRPGKERGTSATTGPRPLAGGVDLLKVFTTNTAFTPGGCYDKFRAYALLEHHGDLRAAAAALARQGYGDSSRPRDTRPAATPVPRPAGEPEQPPEPILVQLSTVVAVPVLWLWDLWLPLGCLVVLDGDPGLGKSTLTIDLAARLTRGCALPPLEGKDQGRGPMGVLLLGAEDVLRHTVRPRLDAAGADPELVWSFEGMRSGDSHRPPALPYDLELLKDFVRQRRIKLIVVDPLLAFIGNEYDAHRDQDIRRCLHPLADLAEELDVVILMLRHLNKLSGGPALYRGTSSIGITGAARASLIVGRDPDQDSRFVLAANKVNLGPRPASLAYRIESAGFTSRIVWDGAVDLRADQILGHGGPPGQRGRPDRAMQAALTMLGEALAGGPRPVKELREWADRAEIGWRTVQSAKAELGILARKDAHFWVWELPEGSAQKNKVPGGPAPLGAGALDSDVESPSEEEEEEDDNPFIIPLR